MKKYFNSYVMAMLAMVLGFGFTAKAQDTSEPVITQMLTPTMAR